MMPVSSALAGFAARNSSRLISIAFCLISLLITGCNRNQISKSSSPIARDANVLLITLDTTRADHLSCYSEISNQGSKNSASTTEEHRSKGAKTPHLDALAARGALFTHDTADVPLTLPSHACIMTGA